MQYFNILDVKVSAINLDKAIQWIKDIVKNKTKTYVCVAPVATIVDCQKDLQYRKIVNNAGMVTPDGMPLVWFAKSKGYKDVSRTYGPDLLLRVLSVPGLRHFFYGGTKESNELLTKNIRERFSNLDAVKGFSPNFQKIGDKESKEILDKINKFNPDVLWIGLGSPKQDYWMFNHRDLLNVPVMIGIGAAFDFIAGIKKQAPKWIQKSGLEWVFRLISEPKRLWKRYLIGNSFFVYCLLKNWIVERFSWKKFS